MPAGGQLFRNELKVPFDKKVLIQKLQPFSYTILFREERWKKQPEFPSSVLYFAEKIRFKRQFYQTNISHIERVMNQRRLFKTSSHLYTKYTCDKISNSKNDVWTLQNINLSGEL